MVGPTTQADSVVSSQAPSVLVLMAEDMGLQLGCYGDYTVPTPNIDALAKRGVLFQNAYATSPTCSPARASFYTGLYPHQHGHYGLGDEYGFEVHPGVPTLNERLRTAGVPSGVTYKVHVNPRPRFRFDHDFTHDWFRRQGSHPWDISRAVEAFADVLDELPNDQPFFFQANSHDTHKPFVGGRFDHLRPKVSDLGEPYRELTADDRVMLPSVPNDIAGTTAFFREQAQYYNAVQRFDWTVGKYLAALEASGRADDTIVILTADHGPPLTRGKLSTYELGLRVPLIVVWPGVAAPGETRDALVSHVDLSPTIDDVLGLTTPEGLAGMSLRPLLRDPDAAWRDYAIGQFFAHTTYRQLHPSYTIRDGRFKLLVNLRSATGPLRGEDAKMVIPANSSDYFAGIRSPSDTLAHAVYARITNRPAVELYDLEDDPSEFHNLAEDPDYADVRARLEDGLLGFREATDDPFLDEDKLQAFMDHYQQKQDEIVAWIEANPDGNMWRDAVRRGDQSRWRVPWKPSGSPPTRLFGEGPEPGA
ncbi:MAG: sulfatase [Planctomycetota bacterium]